ncbi:MAG: hypothetical protein ACRD3T_18170 [Terriglobia bacterium]
MRKTAYYLLAVVSVWGLRNVAAAPQQTVRMNVTSTQGVSPGYKATAGTGLLLNLSPGMSFCGGSIQNYQGGTLPVTASSTNYVYLNPASNCAPSVNITGFAPGMIPISTVVTGATAISTISDARTIFMAGGSSGAGAGACSTSQFVTAVNNGSAPTCTQPAFSNLSGTAASSQLPGATTTTPGTIQLAGDLSGAASTPKVVAIQGVTVAATAPSNGQVPQYNSSTGQWTPATLATGGTVTSVGLSVPPEFSVSGSPVTTSGILTISKASQPPNLVYAGPAGGSAATPSFRALAPADLPAATTSSSGTLQLAGDLSGTSSSPQVVSAHLASPLPAAQGGSGSGSLTAHGVLLGEGTGAFAVAAPGSTGQCLVSNGVSADPSFAACATGGTPGGSNTQLQFNNNGAFGGSSNVTYASSTGVVTLSQLANGNETIYGIRASDTSPTGNLIHFQTAAMNSDLFTVDASGNVTATSFTSTASGPFILSGSEGACTGTMAGKDVLCLGDTNTHSALLSLNGGGFVPVPQIAGDLGGTAASPQVVSTHLSSPLAITQGGTGQATASAAFNAIAPATAAGGLIVANGANSYGNLALGTSGQCLTSSGQSAVWGACGTGGGAPGGSNLQLQFDNNGAFGGAANLTYASTTGLVTLSQLANGNETLYGTRSTDTSPTGNLIHFQNAAKTVDLFQVDASGNVTATSFTSTASGPFILSGSEGACTGATAGKDVLCLGDANTHSALLSLNGGTFVPVPQIAGDLGGTAASPQVVSEHLSHLTQTAANGDIAGTISLSSATSASHTFSNAFTSTPLCVLTPASKPGSGQLWWVTATTTKVTANVSATATITFNYVCVGNPS